MRTTGKRAVEVFAGLQPDITTGADPLPRARVGELLILLNLVVDGVPFMHNARQRYKRRGLTL